MGKHRCSVYILYVQVCETGDVPDDCVLYLTDSTFNSS